MPVRERFSLLRAIAVLLAVLLGLQADPPRPALAHASLTGSTPQPGAILEQAPQVITLEFSESLDPGLSRVRLIDAQDQVIAAGPGEIDPPNAKVLTLTLPALADGAYSATWQVRSAVDGHITSGSVPFSVGLETASASLLPPAGSPRPAAAVPELADILLRWLSYLATGLMAGSLLFALLVWRPAYRIWTEPQAEADRTAARRLRRLAGLGALSLALLTVLLAVYQAWQASQGTFDLSFGAALLELIGHQNSAFFWGRMLLLSLAVLLLRHLNAPGSGPSRPWWEVTVLALGALFSFSLRSHSAAAGSAWAVLLDGLHLTAVTAWTGGLPALFLLIRSTDLPASVLVPRFTLMALASVGVLALSGAGIALLHVRTVEALVSTTYGKALILKQLFFGLLILLGAINVLVLSPRLRERWESAVRGLRNTVRLEMALAGLTLLAAGVMATTPPALEALQAERRSGYVGEYAEGGVRFKLWVAPARAGDNEFAVDVTGLPPGHDSGHAQVLLRLERADGLSGVTQVETQAGEAGRYYARGSYLPTAGDWRIEVILRREGQNDIRSTFDLQVQAGAQDAGIPNPIPASPGSLMAGEALYRDNCLSCHGPQGKGDGPAGLALNPPPADLTIHTTPGVHSDGQLFEWITKGYPGSAMPAFEDLLSEEERWHLVNYIRTLGR